ncbi:hypothetical protein RJ639_010225 [Escallonia herrerae]|uniref:Metallothionein-like protein n=1 Tax=Escallonia herrerae TaxID=1293975 RepID=A0AA88VRR4_9ASTE|nr:hypothetical protein RJ639_010225 [Escallonia herrerae]
MFIHLAKGQCGYRSTSRLGFPVSISVGIFGTNADSRFFGGCWCYSWSKFVTCDCRCGMYPDIEKTTTATIIGGVAPVKTYYEGTEKSFGAEGVHACKCGSNCKCDPCTC